MLERELTAMRDEHGLETAMNFAETLAESNGYLDAERDDPRLFTGGPPDPFTTGRERALAADDPVFEYLPDPDYDFELYQRDDETLELQAVKRWEADDMGYLEREAQIIEDFAPHEQPQAEVKRDVLRSLRESGGLEASMQAAETLAGVHGHLDPERDDPRLFTGGPPDPFTTLRGLEMDTALEVESASPDPSAPWRFDVRPAETPDGEPLGVALTMTVFPDATDGQIPDDEAVTRVQQLEVAHFEDTQSAEAFEREFHTHLMPGVLEGPELAETVAELEGLPGQWVETTGENIVGLTNGERTTLVRQPEDWHPYNPNAEREARIAAEGRHTDPLYESMSRVDDEPPDIDLDL